MIRNFRTYDLAIKFYRLCLRQPLVHSLLHELAQLESLSAERDKLAKSLTGPIETQKAAG